MINAYFARQANGRRHFVGTADTGTHSNSTRTTAGVITALLGADFPVFVTPERR